MACTLQAAARTTVEPAGQATSATLKEAVASKPVAVHQTFSMLPLTMTAPAEGAETWMAEPAALGSTRNTGLDTVREGMLALLTWKK